MFLHSFLKEKVSKRISPGLLLFSVGFASYGYYAYQRFNAPRIPLTVPDVADVPNVPEPKKIATIDTLCDALRPHYPLCFESMLEIYKAAGLMPLLEQAPPLEQPKDMLNRLNAILQKMFLRPRGVERQDLNDKTFLESLQTNLQTEYTKIGLSIAPEINEAKLREILSHPNIWQDEAQESNPSVEMAIIFGSTYLEYKNRQTFFLNSIQNKTIRPILNFNSDFRVYLLGGDRPLEPTMDKEFLDTFKSLETLKPSNEQEMMNMMFDAAVQTINLPEGRIVRIATDSPKEQESQNRPTTAGTLESFIKKAQLQPHCDVTYNIIAISSAPFIRYQRLVTQRQLLKHNIRRVNLTVMGPGITQQMQVHSEVQDNTLIAVTLDNLARELWEITEIMRLQAILTQTPLRRKNSLRTT